MAKLKLNPEATFKHVVQIPVPGGEPVGLELVFKSRGKKAVDELLDQYSTGWNSDMVLDCAVGWDLPEPFNQENVATLVENYPWAVVRIVGGYIDEIHNAREGN